MTEAPFKIAEPYRGPWCDMELAAMNPQDAEDQAGTEVYNGFLRELWVTALTGGNLKSAHKLWGKWQSVVGNDPWADEGWRNFWELQRFGEKFWADFDASAFSDRILLNTFISYWNEADSE